jgi:hypothetical protein
MHLVSGDWSRSLYWDSPMGSLDIRREMWISGLAITSGLRQWLIYLPPAWTLLTLELGKARDGIDYSTVCSKEEANSLEKKPCGTRPCFLKEPAVSPGRIALHLIVFISASPLGYLSFHLDFHCFFLHFHLARELFSWNECWYCTVLEWADNGGQARSTINVKVNVNGQSQCQSYVDDEIMIATVIIEGRNATAAAGCCQIFSNTGGNTLIQDIRSSKWRIIFRGVIPVCRSWILIPIATYFAARHYDNCDHSTDSEGIFRTDGIDQMWVLDTYSTCKIIVTGQE